MLDERTFRSLTYAALNNGPTNYKYHAKTKSENKSHLF